MVFLGNCYGFSWHYRAIVFCLCCLRRTAFRFFVLAAIPYALKILVVGLFVADKDRFTARAKNAFNLIALAVLIGSENGLVSALVPLAPSGTLDAEAIKGIGAVFVFIAYAYYMRMSFQEGVKAHLSAATEEEEKAKQRVRLARNLTLPSSFFLNLTMDVIVPTLLLILVLQQGYCAAFVVTGDLVSGSVENLQAAFQDTLMTDLAEVIWQQILSPVYQAVAPQAKSILATVWPFVLDFWNGVVGIVTELRASSPFWEKVFDAVSSINLRLMNLPDCNPPALPLATVP